MNKEYIQAFDFYSGGAFNSGKKLRGDKWRKLEEKINKSGYSPYEFFYYCKEEHTGKRFPGIMNQPSRLLSNKVWDGFYEYKEKLPEYVFYTVRLFRKKYHGLLPYLGYEVLEDIRFDFPTYFKCEKVLENIFIDDDFKTGILEDNLEEADYILRGVPELREFHPITSNKLNLEINNGRTYTIVE